MRQRTITVYAAFAAIVLQMASPAVAQVPPPPSDAMAAVTDWVMASRDNGGLPYMVIDKVAAEVFVFDGAGMLVGRSPVLVGSAMGDDSVPGVGDRELSNIAPADRTTPAGRFVARFGPAVGHKNVLWVDFPSAVSLHPVITSKKSEHRLERLRSPTPEDNRITYGCINVPAVFYNEVVRPLLTDTNGIVYILPEARPLNEVFRETRLQTESAGL